jgi:hypothetical protein
MQLQLYFVEANNNDEMITLIKLDYQIDFHPKLTYVNVYSIYRTYLFQRRR